MRVITVGTSNTCSEMIYAFVKNNILVHACISRDIDRASEFAKINRVKYYLSDYDKALTSNNYDTVYIALPNALHFEYARKALLAGKNVIVESPLCSSFSEAKTLFDLAKEKNLFVFENMPIFHNQAYRELTKKIDDIKPIKNVILNLFNYSDKYDDFKNGDLPNVFNHQLDGGALKDKNVYNINFVIGLFGMPKEMLYHPIVEKDIDVSGTAIFKYDGFNAILSAGNSSYGNSFCEIAGEGGSIFINNNPSRFDSFDFYEKDLFIKRYSYNIKDYLFYNVLDFYNIIENHDVDKYMEYVKYSLFETKILDILSNK